MLIFDGDLGARAEQDVTIFSHITQTRGKVHRSAGGGVVKAPLIPHHTNSRITERDADAKTEAVPQSFPLFA